MTWVSIDDRSYGVTVVNDGTPGVRIQNGTIMMTLMRSTDEGPGLQSPWPAETLSAHGKHTFSYSLTSHKGTVFESSAFRHGFEAKHKLVGAPVKKHPGTLPSEKSYVSVDASNVVVTVMKKAEDSDKGLVLRAFETAGKSVNATFTLPRSFASIREVNMIEHEMPGSPVMEGDRFSARFGKFDIRTFALE